jgi:hypothetical protein
MNPKALDNANDSIQHQNANFSLKPSLTLFKFI